MKSSTHIAVAATAVALAAVLSTVGTYAYTTYGHWNASQVTYYVNPANTDVSNSAALSALADGASAWSSQSNASIALSYGGQVNDTSTGYDSRNVVIFRNESSGSTIASTYSWASGGVLVDSDIIFHDGGWDFFTGSSGCVSGAYIEDIAAHEFGHMLGLQHSSDNAATMYPSYSRCTTEGRSLSADDIAGIESLYAPDGEGGPGPPPPPLNAPPSVAINAPTAGAVVSQGESVSMSGTASDPEDGNLTPQIAWWSSRDGGLGTGGSMSAVLSTGSHTLRATVVDSANVSTTSEVSVTVESVVDNQAPLVTIDKPLSSQTYDEGQSIPFRGTVSDDGPANLTGNLLWTSDKDGFLGTGGSFNRALTPGSHVITASVTDSGGLAGSTTVSVTVVAAPPPELEPEPNGAPQVAITSPTAGTTVTAPAAVQLSGTATDAEDGNLSAQITWRSSRDGYLGTGGSISKALTTGTHTLTASVTDSGGLAGSTTVSVTVAAAPPPPTVEGVLSVTIVPHKRGPRATLNWSGLDGRKVLVFRNGSTVSRTKNDGGWRETLSGHGSNTYKVCETSSAVCTNEIQIDF